MGAQVIFVVNHAYLDKLDAECANWLSLQGSRITDTPLTWRASSFDAQERQFRSKQAPDVRAALSFGYSDYAAKSTYLIGHDAIVQTRHLTDIDWHACSSFTEVAKQVTKQARYHQYPFYDRDTRPAFRKKAPPSVTPGLGSLTIFSYETDFWSWSDRDEARDMMAKIATYCATGLHNGAFGRVDSKTGHFTSNFRPICTLSPEQRALVHIHNAQDSVVVLPQRDLQFTQEYRQSGEGRLALLKALMASEGYDYEVRPLEPKSSLGR